MIVQIIKKNKIWLIVFVFIGLCFLGGIGLFIFHFGSSDGKVISDFSIAYNQYDAAITDYSNMVLSLRRPGQPIPGDQEQKTFEYLSILKSRASSRLSSLTKNDSQLMSLMNEIGDLSGKEMDSLQAYRNAVKENSPQQNNLKIALTDLTQQRRSQFARFQELLSQ